MLVVSIGHLSLSLYIYIHIYIHIYIYIYIYLYLYIYICVSSCRHLCQLRTPVGAVGPSASSWEDTRA